ncbi:MAG: hypothetical protein M3R65_06220 [Gemmatimonadota bacterium]|nr:hypothetical protein [Gemmatimonadota bacterium]
MNSALVRAIVLPLDGVDTDSAQTIISRDLDNGDRVQVIPATQSSAAAAVVKAVATPQGVSVALLDPLTGAVRQQRDFALPIVPANRDQAIADSLNAAFNERDASRHLRLAHAEGVRDSLQAESAKKPPRLRNDKAKKEYAALIAERATIVRDALAEIATVQGEGARDEALRPEIQAAAVARDASIRDSTATARRWALHGVSDDVEAWITGHRGIAQSRVAYVSNGEIHVVDFDGANDRVVTKSAKGAKAMSPAWRRDGRAIVYSEMTDAGTQIAIVDVNTGKSRLLAATPRGLNITPIFSEDDKWVIYANGGEARTTLVAVRPDSIGSLKYLPINHSFDADEPILSPDGSRIAYVSSRPKTPQIYSSNLDGTDERAEAPAPPKTRVYHTSPDWSPDGRMIAYQQQNGDFQVWVVNRVDHSVRKLTTRGENEDPTWAPDARHIALTSNRGGAKAIWVIDIQSGRFRQLSAAGDARLAAWSGPQASSSAPAVAAAR